ncbi:MAG: hypothetical protein B6244_07260 [Candidatus Cloacimonetes bacterium 4572_55]|nr:MAG: hypothetical protein B6244_07260 [Candidatus Cloacimonetes bacterium 4572_55]
MRSKNDIWMEFHISRQMRDRYQFDLSLFATNGKVILANFHATRLVAHRINSKLDILNFPEKAIKASEINAMGLIDELLHFLIHLYRQQIHPNIIEDTAAWVENHLEPEEIQKILLEFIREFPPIEVYQRDITPEEYLKGQTNGVPNRYLTIEEMFILSLENNNPAFSQHLEFIDDSSLKKNTRYLDMIKVMSDYFDTQPPPLTGHRTLMELLTESNRLHPHSLTDQLETLRKHLVKAQDNWTNKISAETPDQESDLVSPDLLYRPLSAIDFIKEEETRTPFLGANAPTQTQSYGDAEEEPEQYSPDLDWMPRLVMIAKNSYVWLDQLSKKYGRQISRLDHIPDEELDILVGQGITGLWLIGLWERSIASKKIKQLCGNPDAVASAYSLKRYEIAHDLGGDEAYNLLKNKAENRGIQLAGDMVPNHIAIDSDWVAQYPDRFISTDTPPFPSYSFEGPDLSDDSRFQIRIEDKYYTRRDASVVFERIDNETGQVLYIYHGNDGTGMPWNDTAQLDYLKKNTRDAVIETILDAARRFSIIRFDAAMTLAKKHYQRLWYPHPGSGGDIPSRSEFGMTREKFDNDMPIEFWREVVDRVAKEAPDTLLLAEAFWLMEGYFVRTLGMHRVYNSAFMNMLRNEENEKYRQTIKNILEFDPEILKRHVNFMSNPDEETAVSQFGKDEKYFGVCMMMATMPGLPMFGHGQIEGFKEKYGMEYRRSYYDESPDEYLLRRHEEAIFPLLRKRELFADVKNFRLYDFFTSDGKVNQNVFVYSNSHKGDRSLAIYHNKAAETRGWARISARYLVKESGESRGYEQNSFVRGMNIHPAENRYVIYKDHIAGLEYIRRSVDLAENGFFAELGAYSYQIFLEFREELDNAEGRYARLTDYLNGRGVYSVDRALTALRPIHPSLNRLISDEWRQKLTALRLSNKRRKLCQKTIKKVGKNHLQALVSAKDLLESKQDELLINNEYVRRLRAALRLPLFNVRYRVPAGSKKYRSIMKTINSLLAKPGGNWAILLSWLATHNLGKLATKKSDYVMHSRSLIDDWSLGSIIEASFPKSSDNSHDLGLIKILISFQNWFKKIPRRSAKSRMGKRSGLPKNLAKKIAYRLTTEFLRDADARRFLNVNRYKETLWFDSDEFDRLTDWLLVVSLIDLTGLSKASRGDVIDRAIDRYDVIYQLRAAKKKSGYQVEILLEKLKKSIRK